MVAPTAFDVWNTCFGSYVEINGMEWKAQILPDIVILKTKKWDSKPVT